MPPAVTECEIVCVRVKVIGENCPIPTNLAMTLLSLEYVEMIGKKVSKIKKNLA
jgi:hypothetical protein